MTDSRSKSQDSNERYDNLNRRHDQLMELFSLIYTKVKAMRDGHKFFLANTIPKLYGADTLEDPKVPKYAVNLARALGDMEKTIDVYQSAEISGGLTVDSLRQLEEAIANDGKVKDGKKIVDYSPHAAVKHIWKEYLEKKEAFEAAIAESSRNNEEYQSEISKKNQTIEDEKSKRVQAERDRNDLRKSLDEIIAELKSELGEDAK